MRFAFGDPRDHAGARGACAAAAAADRPTDRVGFGTHRGSGPGFAGTGQAFNGDALVEVAENIDAEARERRGPGAEKLVSTALGHLFKVAAGAVPRSGSSLGSGRPWEARCGGRWHDE